MANNPVLMTDPDGGRASYELSSVAYFERNQPPPGSNPTSVDKWFDRYYDVLGSGESAAIGYMQQSYNDLGGGNFWQGAMMSGLVEATNHLAHGGDDPKGRLKKLADELYKLGYTLDEIANSWGQDFAMLIAELNPIYQAGKLIDGIDGTSFNGSSVSVVDNLLSAAGVGGFGFIKFGGRFLKCHPHALERIAARGIAKSQIKAALAQKPFKYYHAEKWKLGYYDPNSKVFVAHFDGAVRTVMTDINPEYINRLIKK